MNLSKKTDPRCWKKWARSGAVALGNAVVVNMGYGMRLVRFTKPTSVKDAVASIERVGCRPATMEELLGDTVKADPIADAPFSNVPYLNWEGGELKLDRQPNGKWSSPPF